FLFFGLCFTLLRAGHASHQLVESLFGGHLFPAAFVVAVLIFVVAGAAASAQDFLPPHGDDGVVGGAFSARAVVGNIIAKTHTSPLLPYYKAIADTWRRLLPLLRTGKNPVCAAP